MDHIETYALVVNFSLARLLLLAANFKWQTRNIDITCAYLYGQLEEEIYMKSPSLYKIKEGMVVKLLRPTYRLIGRIWNIELNDHLVS